MTNHEATAGVTSLALVPRTPLLQLALRAHGAYFILYAVAWELFVDQVVRLVGLPPLSGATAIIASQVTSGSMATIGVMLLGASRKPQLPRFVLAALVVQTVLNLLHDASWLAHGYAPALVVPDAAVIATACGVYVHALARSSRASSSSQPTRGA